MSSSRDSYFGNKRSTSIRGGKRRLGLERLEDRSMMKFELSTLSQTEHGIFTELQPREITPFAGALYFVGTSPADGNALWKTDGTSAGTKMVFDAESGLSLRDGSSSIGIRNLVLLGNRLYFASESGVWESDGTVAGTRKVFSRPELELRINYFENMNGTFYISANAKKINDPTDGYGEPQLFTYDTRTQATTELGWTRPSNGSSGYVQTNSSYFATIGADVYFFGWRAVSPTKFIQGLWKTNGTLNGTKLLSEFRYNYVTRSYVDINNLVSNGSRIFFTLSGTNYGTELWTSDGTSTGTKLVKDINPGLDSSDISHMRVVNGSLIFAANDGTHGSELWKSNGTAAGTFMIKDLAPGSASSSPHSAAVIGSNYYYLADDGTTGAEIFQTDGTASGTKIMMDLLPGIGSSEIDQLFVEGSKLIFSGRQSTNAVPSLWTSAGSPATTIPLNSRFSGKVSDTAVVGNSLYLNGSNMSFAFGDQGYRTLAKIDLTSGKAGIVPYTSNADKDAYSLYYSEEFVSGNSFYFVDRANRYVSGDLYRVDSLNGNRDLVAAAFLTADQEISSFRTFKNGRVLLFTEYEIFVFNPSTRTKELVYQSGGGTDYAYLLDSQELNDGRIVTRIGSDKIVVSDGTVSGTFVLGKNHAVLSTAVIREIRTLGNRVLFLAAASGQPQQLWSTDGTDAGTMLLKSFPSSPDYYQITMKEFPILNGKAFFTMDDGIHGLELWVTDGTGLGTKLLYDSRPGSDGSVDLGYLAFFSFKVGNSLFFPVDIAGVGISDGTPEGTKAFTSHVVTDLGDSVDAVVGAVNGLAIIRSEKGRYFSTDGTDAGTTMLLESGSYFLGYVLQTDSGGSESIYFVGSQGDRNRELWRTDGTKSGTRLLRDIRAGSSPGMRSFEEDPLQQFDVAQLKNEIGKAPFTIGGSTFFVANDGIHGDELWQTDGTPTGTYMTADLVTGSGSSHPENLRAVGDTLFFTAYTREAGRQWYMIRYTTNAPVIALSGTTEYRENAVPVILAPNAVVTTRENKISNYARLTVSISSGATVNDRLSIVPQGNGAGQVNVSGKNVLFGGAIVGTFVGGPGVTPLTITMNASATPQIMQAITRRIAFQTLGDTPSTTPRVIGFQGTDGAGAIGQVTRKTVTVTAVNDAPVLQFSGTMRYTRGGTGALLAPNAIVSDIDSPALANGKLTVSYGLGVDAGNRIEFTGGSFSYTGNVLFADGIAIGTIVKSGWGVNDLEIIFNSAAKTEIVQRLVRSLRFHTTLTAPAGQRLLNATLTDGSGGVSNVSSKTIQVN